MNQLEKAKQILSARCRYEQETPSFKMPKVTIRIALMILALGFAGLGIASIIQPMPVVAGVAIGSVFFAIALII